MVFWIKYLITCSCSFNMSLESWWYIISNIELKYLIFFSMKEISFSWQYVSMASNLYVHSPIFSMQHMLKIFTLVLIDMNFYFLFLEISLLKLGIKPKTKLLNFDWKFTFFKSLTVVLSKLSIILFLSSC